MYNIRFFNVNEANESREEKIDLTQPHVILEKLDGSMIGPIIVNGKVRMTTKKGYSPGIANSHFFFVSIFSRTKCRKVCNCKARIWNRLSHILP